MSRKEHSDPQFSRGQVAKILNVTPLTISNREKKKKYPEPRRDLNRYRVYSLQDVLNLQLITYSHVDPRPIVSILYDMGFRDSKLLAKLIDNAISKRVGA